MTFEYEKYLRMQYIPHMWCPGCGIGIVLKAILRSIEAMGWKNDDIAFVSGIGCTSRMPGYVDFNTLHTTHGRALAFATGLKMARPEKHVIVVAGDGDSTAIGGNHFIHFCRRNININMIIVDNNIYGMTGGQYSPTTPPGMYASTSPYGHVEPNFDIARLAVGAGATYVARGTVAQGLILEKYIKTSFAHQGTSVVVAESTCPVQFGRRNRLGDPVNLLHWVKDHSIPMSKAKNMTKEELDGKFVTGEFVKDDSKLEYTERSRQLAESVRQKKKD